MSEQNLGAPEPLIDTASQQRVLGDVLMAVRNEASQPHGGYLKEEVYGDAGTRKLDQISDAVDAAVTERTEVFNPADGYTVSRINVFGAPESNGSGITNKVLKNRATLVDQLYEGISRLNGHQGHSRPINYGRSLNEKGQSIRSRGHFGEDFSGDKAIIDDEGSVRGVRLDLGSGVYAAFHIGKKKSVVDSGDMTYVDLYVLGPQSKEDVSIKPKVPEIGDVDMEVVLKGNDEGVGKTALSGATGEASVTGDNLAQDKGEGSNKGLDEFMKETESGVEINKRLKDLKNTRAILSKYVLGEDVEISDDLHDEIFGAPDAVPGDESLPLSAINRMSDLLRETSVGIYEIFQLGINQQESGEDFELAQQAVDKIREYENALLDTAEVMAKNPKLTIGSTVCVERTQKDDVGNPLIEDDWEVTGVTIGGKIRVFKIENNKPSIKKIAASDLHRLNP